ncbi:MAG: glucan 1,4-alpha-glucosidase [Anaerolineales bacterium]|nr:MAG: glucan 1,4-alpha-glucosidase [Anaerolineales bacterium]
MAASFSAPGHPGIPPRWTSSAKSGVGTSLSESSRVWFTLSHGILNEVYYPRIDQACVRDMELLVSDGKDFFSEEKRGTSSEIRMLAEGTPAFELTNTCNEGRYRIHKTVLTDPQRHVLLQKVRFEPLQGTLGDYHLHILLAPHLGNHGAGNTAWVDDYKGLSVLNARRGETALSLACSVPWLKRSVGFVGISDGWQDVHQHRQMLWEYDRAENGNVALTAEIDLASCNGEFVIALGFGLTPAESGLRARASLEDGFDSARDTYLREWQEWQNKLMPPANLPTPNLYRTSAAVLRSHESKRFPGGMIASLSIPWGFNKGDEDMGGYHLVWPRDLVETAGGLLAIGAHEDVRRVLHYLQDTQEADGHWPQNMWMDGSPYWNGIQMDETAFPILLVDLARRRNALDAEALSHLWPMVRKAAEFLLSNGPVTPQDRWEEDPGYSPFTLSVEIAALLTAADLADRYDDPAAAKLLRETADMWNARIEDWTYVRNTELAKQIGVEGYYVRIAPPEETESSSPLEGFVPIKNRPPGESEAPAAHIVSPDALALVRFGLRAADDPRIVNTVRVIDALLKTETPAGPIWRRYNEDGYGEHEDGSPFDGNGMGRPWPLLTAERAHYELAAGRSDSAHKLLGTLQAFANAGGLIPEQTWDGKDIPERELFFGQPSGSAMPLVWAHAEYLKLCRSLADGRVFDMPPQTAKRYPLVERTSEFTLWAFNHKIRKLKQGKTLRLFLSAPARIRWSTDEWSHEKESDTHDSTLGIHIVDIPTHRLSVGTTIRFTIHWLKPEHWEGTDYIVEVTEP